MANRFTKLYEKIRPTLKWLLPGLSTVGVLTTLALGWPNIYRTYFVKPMDTVLEITADEKGLVDSFDDRWAAMKPFDAALLMRLAEAARVQMETPNAKVEFPKVNSWDFGYAVDYYAQGDGEDEAVKETIWLSCVTPGPKPAICLETPEYRRTHHLHRKDWRK